MEDQLVVFRLASDLYGIEISSVDGIIKMQRITTIPLAQGFVEGVINLRGKVLPVIDLRKRFGVVCHEATKDTRIVVADCGGATVGMVVDEVTGVMRAAQAAIEPPARIVTTVESGFIRGIAKIGEQLVILLDLSKVLSIDEVAELEDLPAVA